MNNWRWIDEEQDVRKQLGCELQPDPVALYRSECVHVTVPATSANQNVRFRPINCLQVLVSEESFVFVYCIQIIVSMRLLYIESEKQWSVSPNVSNSVLSILVHSIQLEHDSFLSYFTTQQCTCSHGSVLHWMQNVLTKTPSSYINVAGICQGLEGRTS